MSEVRTQPGLDDVILCESEVCLIAPEESLCALRGHRIDDLARTRTYDEVACLLVRGHLPEPAELTEFRAELGTGREVGAGAWARCARGGWSPGAHPMDLARTAASCITLEDPGLVARPLQEQAALLVGAVFELSARLCRAVAGAGAADQGAVLLPGRDLATGFLATATGRAAPEREAVRALEQVMVLHAEHELNASTFAARVVASTLSDLPSAVVAGIGALKGPLHGGANEAALRMIHEVGHPERAEAWLSERLAQREKIMGFGHRVYKSDPREGILRELAEARTAAAGHPELYQVALRLEGLMASRKGLHPNPDLYSGLTYEAVGLPGGCETVVFTAARTAGWCAHAIEQLEHNRLIRPRARYVGPGVDAGPAVEPGGGVKA